MPAKKVIDKPLEINAKNFGKKVQDHEFIVIDFWSEACPPCKMLAPIIDALAKELKGKVVFGKLSIDVQEHVPLAIQFGIRGVPTLLVFKKGKLADTIVGYAPKDQLKQMLGV